MSAPQDQDQDAQLKRLSRIDDEYRVTMQALAVLVELYLLATDAVAVSLAPEKMADPPDLSAWKDSTGVIHLAVTR